MCIPTGGVKLQEAPPEKLPEAPQTPKIPSIRSAGSGGVEGDIKRRRAAGGSAEGTILTGTRGITDGAQTQVKTLLGA